MPTKGKKNRKREACVEKFVNKWWMPELMFRVMELVFFKVATDFLSICVCMLGTISSSSNKGEGTKVR